MEQIEYTRTVVPSSMRSPYWKYFGFPSDSGNNILTRQKIVCTICNTAIAYNKNTSNLRTHLMSKHVEVFQNIVMSSNSKMALKPENMSVVEAHLTSVKKYDPLCTNTVNLGETKRRCNDSHDEFSESIQSKKHFVETFLTIPDYNTRLEGESNILGENCSPVVANKLDLENRDYIGFIPSKDNDIVEESENVEETLAITSNSFNEQTFSYDNVELHNQQLHSMDIMLADMIQTDLLSLDLLENNGFCKYNQQLTGIKMDNETVKRVREVIETRFTKTEQLINSRFVRLSQIQPYSLSIEIYTDNDGQDILNIYCNYLNEAQTNLTSILYVSSVFCTNSINISELLMDVNLLNCSGVVVSSLDNLPESVSDFTKYHELPLIECLECILTRYLDKIFNESEFRKDFSNILKIIKENTNQMHIKKSILRRCHWSMLNILDDNFNNIDQSAVEHLCEMKRSYEYLKPLKMALDIIKDEHLPLCTLNRPLIIKLFEEHYSSINQEESIRIHKIRKILGELHERIIGQHFLNEATFFDTRFHRNFALQESTFEIHNLKSLVVKRFRHILEVSHINNIENIKSELSTDALMNFRKCSSLKSFFQGDSSLTNTEVTTVLKTNLDLEFERYQNEANLDLEQSPALWWQQQADNYHQLSKIASRYLTIPCSCLPRICRLDVEERYSKIHRRQNLSQFCNIESKLWYLHYNDAATEFL